MNERIRPKIFYIILFLFILAISLPMWNFDYDLWARLIVGMHFMQTGRVLKQDFLSYTPTHEWFDHEWGSGVIFYITQHFFGEFGLIILQTILIFLMFFIITKTVELRGVKTTTPYNFLFYLFTIGAINAIYKTPIRCQIFSFLFFALYLYILELARSNKSASKFSLGGDIGIVISLPLIMIVWNNLHGGCVSGIGLIAIYIIGEFLNKKSIKKYIYALITTILVLPINPWGLKYLGFLFSANTMSRPDIIEWWGLFCTYNLYKFIRLKLYMATLLLVEFGFMLKSIFAKKYDFDKTKFLVITSTLVLAILHTKLIPLFVISAICFIYDDFYTAFNYITCNIFNKIVLVKDIVVYGFIIIFIIGSLNPINFRPIIDFGRYPYLSIEFIKINKLKGNLLTNFGTGSYASYKLYPNNKIFMDGRYEEVYYDYMVPLLKKFYLANTKDWDAILKRFPPDIIILEKYYPIYQVLQLGNEWALAFDKDHYFGVFVRKKELQKQYKMPNFDPSYYKENLFKTNIDFISNPVVK